MYTNEININELIEHTNTTDELLSTTIDNALEIYIEDISNDINEYELLEL